MEYHKPVMLNEVLAHLSVKRGGRYIDCTLGDGGHAVEILKLGGNVLGIDVNAFSLEKAKSRVGDLGLSKSFIGVKANFKDVDKIAQKVGFEKANGILYDLGWSSSQLDETQLGLSFQRDEALDMRIDESLGVTAADLVNSLSEKELAELIFRFSGERLAKRFARAITKNRNLKKIQTTKELADVLVSEAPWGYESGRIHPATRVFQALRIAVNDEIENLEQSLPRAARLLLPGGRMVIISFQSLEDKVAKEFGRSAQPLVKELYKRPLTPTLEEIRDNVRARSAKMRVLERI